MKPIPSLIGRKFGKLFVTAHAGTGKRGGINYLCKCECGTDVYVLAYKLNKGDRSHCGKVECRKDYKTLTGLIFGKLTVVGPIERTGRHKTVWLCKCDCGNEKEVRRMNLLQGNTLSCSCLRMDRQEESIKTEAYRSHIAGSKSRSIDSQLSMEEYLEIASKPCHYCSNIDTKRNRSTRLEIKLNGIDRKNNEKYYKHENSIPCCKTCNRMKGKMAYDVFLLHIKNILDSSPTLRYSIPRTD